MYEFPLYFISFTYDKQDELIKLIEESKTLDKSELEILDSYKRLCKSLNYKPSLQLLQEKFPRLVFTGLTALDEKQLDEKVRLDIQSRKDDKNASELLGLASKIKKEGMSESITNRLADMSKIELGVSKYRDLTSSLKDIYVNASTEKGISSCVDFIDKETGGFQPGTFNTVAGYAGAGKTTAAVNIAYGALLDGKNVCYITLEVPKINMYYNFGSRHSMNKKFKKQISHSVVKKKELTKEDTDYFFDTIIPDLNELPGKLYILDETEIESYTFSSFENKIRECDRLAFEENGRGIDLLIIDQAQLLKFSSNMSSAGKETSVINLYVSFFRQQAINFLREKRTCTVIMLSQFNRDGFAYACKHQGQYTLTHLAEANELERASTLVIALFTDESLKAGKQAQVQLLKSRDGKTLVDPTIVFMDPFYYCFGNKVSNGGTMFQGVDANALISMSMGAVDLNQSSTSQPQMVNDLSDLENLVK